MPLNIFDFGKSVRICKIENKKMSQLAFSFHIQAIYIYKRCLILFFKLIKMCPNSDLNDVIYHIVSLRKYQNILKCGPYNVK